MKVKFYNPASGKIEDENVCAEGFINFLYGNPAGAPLLWAVFKRAFFSRMCGAWADSGFSAKKIAGFVSSNGVDMTDSAQPVGEFKTFNAFFTRALKDGARPCEPETPERSIISFPSDGRHLLVENLSAESLFYAKGARFNLAEFLGSETLAERFGNGSMLISRLCPLDYHRFHFPVSGTLVARKCINGFLKSVSPIALARNLSILWTNKRVLNVVETGDFGLCAFVEIGATNVGSIENFADVGESVCRGAQAGLFRFGGSCVVSVFENVRGVEWNEDLKKYSAKGIECYARACSTAGVREK